MIYASSPALDGLRYVVLDEVHYLQDRYRGPVWEEVIVHLARRSGSCASRPRCRTPRRWRRGSRPCAAATAAVIEERRPVDPRAPLPRGGAGQRHRCTSCPTFVAEPRRRARARTPTRPGSTPATAGATPGVARARPRARACARPSRVETVELPRGRGRCCPAIVFVFSRAGLRPGRASSASPPGCASPTRDERDRDPRDRRRARPRRSPTTTSTCCATTSGSPGSRPASPRTTRAWCRR